MVASNSEVACSFLGLSIHPYLLFPNYLNTFRHVSIPVAIYEKESTSIIAYALSSHKYVQELKAMREKKQNASAPLDPAPPSPKLYAQNLAHAQ